MNKKVSSLIIGSFFAFAATLSMGAGQAFAAGPSVNTTSATAITSSSAVIAGAYNTNGSTAPGADTRFDWGVRAGSSCTVGDLTTSTSYISYPQSTRSFTVTLTGLSAGTNYCFRAFASNSATGPGYGAILPFTTTSGSSTRTAPSVITSSASPISTAATLNGAFNGHGSSTDTQFFWGTSSTNLTHATGYVTQSGTSGSFSANISGLTPSTKYYFQAVARNSAGTVMGTILPFTTSASTGVNCTIDNFSTSNNSVTSGNSVTLSWTTTGCTSGTIDNGVGTASPISQGSISSGPITHNTTFTLTANDGSQYDNDTVTVLVSGQQNSCSLSSFYASPSVISYGGSSTLIFDGSGCSNISISPATGGAASAYSTSYSTGTLYASQTYTITASGNSGAARTLTTSVTVNNSGTTTGGTTGSSACSIDYFNASPATVTYGQSALLNWSTSNCASVYIDNGVGSQYTSSNAATSPLYASTWFNLTATDYYGGTTTKQLFVGVTNYSGTTGGSTGYGSTGYGSYCVINSFTASPATVSPGQTATLSWNTSGCTSTTLTGGTALTQFEPANGSATTGVLYGTTTFVLYGNGGQSASAQTVVYVVNGQYAYQYACTSGSSDPSCTGQYAGTVLTTLPTNVGSNSARLNGIANNITGSWAGYFEYGTTRSLGRATGFQNSFPVTSYNFYDTINVSPSTTYYYRAVAQINGTIVRGDIYSFTTPVASTTNIVYVQGSSSSAGSQSTVSGGTTTNASGVTVTVTNQGDKVNVGDTVQYTVTYANNTNNKLKNAIMTVVLPQGFSVKQTTQGMMQPPSMVTSNIGDIAPGQTGSIFIQATVDANTATNQTLVTNATLSYTLANGAHDSAVGYVLNHASIQNVFAGFALGSGFFPSTIWGWFLTLIIILIIVLISRRIARAKHADHGHGGHDAHGHGPVKH